jgi:hypothetical protein
MTTVTTPTESVALDCRRRARVGVGPCRMARVALKGLWIGPRCCARLPASGNAKPQAYWL